MTICIITAICIRWSRYWWSLSVILFFLSLNLIQLLIYQKKWKKKNWWFEKYKNHLWNSFKNIIDLLCTSAGREWRWSTENLPQTAQIIQCNFIESHKPQKIKTTQKKEMNERNILLNAHFKSLTVISYCARKKSGQVE